MFRSIKRPLDNHNKLKHDKKTPKTQKTKKNDKTNVNHEK